MTDLEFKQQVLDPMSASFCGAKWYNATIWLGSGQTTSCHHPPAHRIPVEDIRVNPRGLHNTAQKKQDRADMQAGRRPAGCEYCWKIEDMGRDAVSDRVYKSKIYSIAELHTAFDTMPNQDVDLRTLEIAFDRTCQFACSYCNPAFSSTWVRDIRRNGAYTGLVTDGRNHFTHAHDAAQPYRHGESNPYVDAFFAWWESDLHRTLQELRITGGEPLMSGETWKLLDWFRANKGRSTTRLAINTNLGAEVDVDRLLDSIEGLEVDIYTSNESMGAQAEYIRDGLNWQAWVDNMHRIAGSGRVRALHVMNTVNALCLDSLPEFIEFMIGLKSQYGRDFPNFTLNILRFPSFQSPLVLSDQLRAYHSTRLKDLLARYQDSDLVHAHERQHIQRLVDYLAVVTTPHSDAHDVAQLRRDFHAFFAQYDQRRQKDFHVTFPRLSKWYNDLSI